MAEDFERAEAEENKLAEAGEYERDEIDELAQQRTVQGAHRVQKRSYKWVIAFIAVIVLAPLAGYGMGAGMAAIRTGLDEKPASQANTQQDADVKSSADTEAKKQAEEQAEAEAKAKAEAEEKAKAEAAAAVKYETPIKVLNGAGIQGLAGEKAVALEEAGFTSVEADNYDSKQPTESTVYYGNAELKGTADEVASKLGISITSEDTAAATGIDSITVILRG